MEAAETRKNSQLAREVRVALPAELSHAQRVELVRDFCQRSFVDRGMVTDIALHAPGLTGDERNHHAHILLTTREIDAEGFTAKNRDWNAVAVLEDWREAWAQDSNLALERSGLEARIDHRRLEAQREEALELVSLGAWQLKERGIEVAAVRVWHEVRERALEVGRVAQELAAHARDWLGRVVERALEALEPAQDAWGDFFAEAAGGDLRDDLARDLDRERQVEQQREIEREAHEQRQHRQRDHDLDH